MNRVKFVTMNALNKKDDMVIRVSDNAAVYFTKKSNEAQTRKLNRLERQVDQLAAEIDAHNQKSFDEDAPINLLEKNFLEMDEVKSLLAKDDAPEPVKLFIVDSNGVITS